MTERDTSQTGIPPQTKAVYYVSDRPEAYEVWAEVGHTEAQQIARTIVRHAAALFPEIDFRTDGGWHSHQQGMEHVASVIEENWQTWAEEINFEKVA